MTIFNQPTLYVFLLLFVGTSGCAKKHRKPSQQKRIETKIGFGGQGGMEMSSSGGLDSTLGGQVTGGDTVGDPIGGSAGDVLIPFAGQGGSGGSSSGGLDDHLGGQGGQFAGSLGASAGEATGGLNGIAGNDGGSDEAVSTGGAGGDGGQLEPPMPLRRDRSFDFSNSGDCDLRNFVTREGFVVQSMIPKEVSEGRWNIEICPSHFEQIQNSCRNESVEMVGILEWTAPASGKFRFQQRHISFNEPVHTFAIRSGLERAGLELGCALKNEGEDVSFSPLDIEVEAGDILYLAVGTTDFDNLEPFEYEIEYRGDVEENPPRPPVIEEAFISKSYGFISEMLNSQSENEFTFDYKIRVRNPIGSSLESFSLEFYEEGFVEPVELMITGDTQVTYPWLDDFARKQSLIGTNDNLFIIKKREHDYVNSSFRLPLEVRYRGLVNAKLRVINDEGMESEPFDLELQRREEVYLGQECDIDRFENFCADDGSFCAAGRCSMYDDDGYLSWGESVQLVSRLISCDRQRRKSLI